MHVPAEDSDQTLRPGESTVVLDALLGDCRDAIVTIDEGGVVRYASASAVSRFGPIGQGSDRPSILNVIHPDDRDRISSQLTCFFADEGATIATLIAFRIDQSDTSTIDFDANLRKLPPSTLGRVAVTLRERANVEFGAELAGSGPAVELPAQLKGSLEKVGQLTRGDVVVVLVEDRTTQRLDRRAIWINPSHVPPFDVADVAELEQGLDNPAVERLLTETLVIDDVTGSDGFQSLTGHDSTTSLLCAPFGVGTERGVLAILRFQPGPRWLEADTHLVRNTATQFGYALTSARSDELLRRTYEGGPIGFCTRTPSGDFVDCNDRYLALLGIPRDDVEELLLEDILHPDDYIPAVADFERLRSGETARVSRDCRVILPDLATRWIRVNAVQLETHGWQEPLVLLSIEDVSESHAQRAELEHAARHDFLTGLANRATLREHIVRFHAENDRLPNLFILDLDRFKQVNDSLGHSAGDELLAEVASRLLDHAGVLDFVARLGGDEFAVMLNDRAPERAIHLAKVLGEVMETPIMIGGRPLHQTMSIGIALGEECEDLTELMMNADRAMYAAKRSGRNLHAVFDKSMRYEVATRLARETELRCALEAHQLEIHFQPEVDLGTGEVRAAEALLRWRHPDRGLLTAAEFVGLAEQSGLIDDLGQFARRVACRSFAALTNQAGRRDLLLRINVSAAEFERPDLTDLISGVLIDSGLDPHRLCLEMSEATLMESPEQSLTILESLRNLGVKLAIDNFGTGSTSLIYLKRFAVDALKIDRAFVEMVAVNDETRAVVQSIVGLGHAMSLKVIGEGVETPDQLSALRELGCDTAHGFLMSDALRPCDFMAYISRSEHDA